MFGCCFWKLFFVFKKKKLCLELNFEKQFYFEKQFLFSKINKKCLVELIKKFFIISKIKNIFKSYFFN